MAGIVQNFMGWQTEEWIKLITINPEATHDHWFIPNEEQYIIDLVYGYISNERSWTGNSGTGYELKYTFDSSLNFQAIDDVDIDDLSDSAASGDTLSQRDAAVDAMLRWSEVANITFFNNDRITSWSLVKQM